MWQEASTFLAEYYDTLPPKYVYPANHKRNSFYELVRDEIALESPARALYYVTLHHSHLQHCYLDDGKLHVVRPMWPNNYCLSM